MTFKVGESVKLTGPGWDKAEVDLHDLHTVENINYEGHGVIRGGWVVYDVEGHDWAAERVYGGSSELESMGSDSINPKHYQFPGGTEVRDISAYLTSFGGQALQYVARATRLDGHNKGNPVEDLKKAVLLIEWEIDRLEAE